MAEENDIFSKLSRRMDQLERQNRFFKRASVLMLIVATSLLFMGQTKKQKVSNIVEAEKFILRDPQGKIRGGLAIDSQGIARLALADEEGKTHVTLSVNENGRSGLYVTDSKGLIRAGLASLPDGTPDLGLADAQGVVRVGIGFDKARRSPALVFYDSNKNAILKLP
jgi:hypothetical protein